MGWIMSRFFESGPEVSIAVSGMTRSWISIVEAAADEDERVDFRVAAARSILHSDALVIWTTGRLKSQEVSSTLLRLWIIVMKLLNDEDEDVREAVKKAVVNLTFKVPSLGDLETSQDSSPLVSDSSEVPVSYRFVDIVHLTVC